MEGVYLEYIHIVVLCNDMKVNQLVFPCYTAALVKKGQLRIAIYCNALHYEKSHEMLAEDNFLNVNRQNSFCVLFMLL